MIFIKRMRRKTILPAVLSLVCAGLVTGTPYLALAAQDITVTPVVFDEKAKARDILQETLKITNTTDHVIQLYPSVNNVLAADGQQQFNTAYNGGDLASSLANWIEISRGVIELAPGEEKNIPFTIRIALNAIPNDYHANISFGAASTRAVSDGGTPLAVIAVNLEVEADVREVLQLDKFTSDNMVFTGDDVLFNYQLQNIGNQDLQPTGDIRIYDRKGTEVAAVDVNKDGKTVSPDQTAQLASVWSAVNGFGKFKALLTVNYGKGQTAAVQDTVYFWIIPWKQLLMIFSVTVIAVVILIAYFHRWFEERHLGKLAHAGLLKVEELAHIHPHAHPAEIHAAVEEHVAKKKNGIFSFFRRSSSAEVASMTVSSPAPVPSSPQRVISAPRSLRESFGSSTVTMPERGSLGGTIDLKQLHIAKRNSGEERVVENSSPSAPATSSNSAPHVEVQGSVINLRKRQ